MKFSIVQDSRAGARPYNQDRVGHWRTEHALLLALADGMGGHLRGELAAQVALEHLGAEFAREARPRLADPDLFLFRAIGRAHAAIHKRAVELRLAEDPRTTVVACVVQDGWAYWGHVGDSRLYLIRKGRVLARTRDHTRVQQLVDEGRIREEAISSHPERNRLLQCLGGAQAPHLEPAACARLARDDVVLLCSDGFWGPLTQRQIAGALLAADLGRAVAELVSLAERRAGRECDNVSVVAIAWGEEEARPAETPRTEPQRDPPTVVQDFTATDLDYLRMSDEEVEKAIAEIKAALRKNAPSR
jgi:serine/threonine protein phosphatase PrpC